MSEASSPRPNTGVGADAPVPAAPAVPEAEHHTDAEQHTSGVALYWLPLGAGGPAIVRFSGRAYETIAARLARRAPADLYHAALEVHTAGARHIIELAPAFSGDGTPRGVVVTGAVGSPLLGRSRWFRYELRCWPGGTIPDREHAVDSPRWLSRDLATAHRVLASAASVPPLTWGRDTRRAGEMWNSNSAIAWILATARVPLIDTVLPAGGRAPGWGAGLAVAAATAERAADVSDGPIPS